MKSKFFLKFIAILMLAVGLATIPTVYFSEPAVAAAKKRAKKKTGKKRTTKRKTSASKKVTTYRCARCGEWWFQGADPRLDFVYRLAQCRYGGMHSWRKIR